MDVKDYKKINTNREMAEMKNEGDFVTGKFYGVCNVTVQDRTVACLEIEDEKGNHILVAMNGTIERVPADVPIGTDIMIVLEGKKQTKRGRMMNVYAVYAKGI